MKGIIYMSATTVIKDILDDKNISQVEIADALSVNLNRNRSDADAEIKGILRYIGYKLSFSGRCARTYERYT